MIFISAVFSFDFIVVVVVLYWLCGAYVCTIFVRKHYIKVTYRNWNPICFSYDELNERLLSCSLLLSSFVRIFLSLRTILDYIYIRHLAGCCVYVFWEREMASIKSRKCEHVKLCARINVFVFQSIHTHTLTHTIDYVNTAYAPACARNVCSTTTRWQQAKNISHNKSNTVNLVEEESKEKKICHGNGISIQL